MLPSMTLATRPGGRILTRNARAPRVARFTSPAAAPAPAHGQPARAVHATAAPGGADGPAGASTSSRAVPEEASSAPSSTPDLAASVTAAACLLLASAGPAWADAADAAGAADFSKGGFAKESYYVTLGLFLLSLPGEREKERGRERRDGEGRGQWGRTRTGGRGRRGPTSTTSHFFLSFFFRPLVPGQARPEGQARAQGVRSPRACRPGRHALGRPGPPDLPVLQGK
jgi:hypothetical protein